MAGHCWAVGWAAGSWYRLLDLLEIVSGEATKAGSAMADESEVVVCVELVKGCWCRRL